MQLINQTTNAVISENLKIANTFWSRFLGLMFMKSIDREDALVIKPCNNVHMFFMQFPIDVLFIDKDGIVCFIQENLRPGSISKYRIEARYIVELPAFRAMEKKIEVGAKIAIQS